MHISIKRTAEGAPVIYFRSENNSTGICLLDYLQTDLPMFPDVDYAVSTGPVRDIWMATEVSKYFNEYATLETVGVSAGVVDSGLKIGSVNDEVAFKSDYDDIAKFYSAVLGVRKSNLNIRRVLSRLATIKNDHSILRIMVESYYDHGLMYAAPLLRTFFMDAVMNAANEANALGDKATAAQQVLGSMSAIMKANKPEALEGVRSDIGVTARTYGMIAPFIVSSCFQVAKGLENQVLSAALVLKCLTYFVPMAVYGEEVNDIAIKQLSGPKFERYVKSGGIDPKILFE